MTRSSSTQTRAGSVHALIVAVIEQLEELPASAHKRELHAQALSYAETLRGWEARRPSPAQRGALLDLVTDLHAKALVAKRRTLRPPR